MRIRPGYEVYWRAPGVCQVGLDPRCAVVLDQVGEKEQRLLEELSRGHGTDPVARGRELGIPPARVTRLVAALRQADVLLEDDAVRPESADGAYWQLAEVAGQVVPTHRAASVVRVRGLDQLGLRAACLLAQAGVGTVLGSDPMPVLAADVGGGLYRPGDVGRPRARVATAVLRMVAPMVRVSAPSGRAPDVEVLVHHRVVDPVPVRELMRRDAPHLVVTVRELDVVVGPFVRPGTGACSRCIDLHRCADDPRWPVVATQAANRPQRGVESTLASFGAVLAATQVLAALDARPVATHGASLEVTAWDPLPVVREWQVHPDCGCTTAALTA